MHGSPGFAKSSAVYCNLECHMHRGPSFAESTILHYVLECYMHDILTFSKTDVAGCFLEYYIHGSSIQLVAFKPLSYCFKKTVGFDK